MCLWWDMCGEGVCVLVVVCVCGRVYVMGCVYLLVVVVVCVWWDVCGGVCM